MPHRFLCLAGLLLLAACSGSDGPKDELLAQADIGPAGGQLEVTNGQYDGLRLTVPGGALASAVTVTMWKPAPSPSGALSPLVVGGPGPFVRIDPPTVVFLTPATLRLPYLLQQVVTTGPGNVQAMHYSTTGHIRIDPPVVDVHRGLIEVPIPSLGGFQVVPGPHAPSLDAYLPALGTSVPLEDGFTFTYQQLLAPHMPGRNITRWTVDTTTVAHAIDFELWQIAGRAGLSADWQEVWDTPLDVLLHEANTLTPPARTSTRIYSPISSPNPLHSGQVSVLGRFGFEVPLRLGNREYRDVLRIRLITSWERPDLGTGSSIEVFWFAPDVGLLQMQQDGVIRVRTDL